jgi:hypothetical protein
LLETEKVKQRGTHGAWLRPAYKQQPGTQVDKGSSSGLGFKSVASLRGASGGRRSERGRRRNMFCLLETTIHFVHASSFYFDQELLQYCLQYESYSYNI